MDKFTETKKVDELKNDLKSKSSILVCTSLVDRKLNLEYFSSFLQTKDHFLKQGQIIDYCIINNKINSIDVKNSLISYFMLTSYSHILFVNSDVHWKPIVVQKLLDMDRDVISAPILKPGYQWGKLSEYINNGNELKVDQIYPLLTDYMIKTAGIKENTDGTLETDFISCDFMLIKRHVIEALIKSYDNKKYRNPDMGMGIESEKYLYNFFYSDVNKGIYISPDETFCSLLKSLNFKIYVDLKAPVNRVSTEIISGNMESLIEIMKNARDEPISKESKEEKVEELKEDIEEEVKKSKKSKKSKKDKKHRGH
jgi:hypothetical protein